MSAKQWLRSACAFAQADQRHCFALISQTSQISLGERWAHMHSCRKCCASAEISEILLAGFISIKFLATHLLGINWLINPYLTICHVYRYCWMKDRQYRPWSDIAKCSGWWASTPSYSYTYHSLSNSANDKTEDVLVIFPWHFIQIVSIDRAKLLTQESHGIWYNISMTFHACWSFTCWIWIAADDILKYFPYMFVTENNA